MKKEMGVFPQGVHNGDGKIICKIGDFGLKRAGDKIFS